MNLRLIDKEEDILKASKAIKAMAHPLRLKVLCILGGDELNVQSIVESIGTSQSNISQHLAIMREQGVLTTRKNCNQVFYRIDDPRTLRLVSMMREVFCTSA
jgi:ArsR family transcriptional regulator